MSKLGLNRSGKPSKCTEPPDKRRKVDTADALWDDDFDMILTQNLNAIDDLIASQHVGRDRTSSAESRRNGAAACPLSTDSDAVSAAGTSTSNGMERPSSRMMIGESNGLSTAKNSTRFEGKPPGTGVALRSSSFGPGSSSRPLSTDDRKSSESDLVHPGKGLVTENGGAVANSGIEGSETADVVHSSAMTGNETISPALPGASAQVAPIDVTGIMEECNYYKTEMNKLKENQYAKDGQIKILREKYDQAQTEMNRKNLEIVRILNQKSEEKSKKEAELEAENEKLRTQLQFRQQEVVEIKNQLKRVEKLSADTSSDTSRSPVVGSRTLPKSPNMSKSPSSTKRAGLSNFPSSQSFLAPNKMSSSHSASDLIGLTKPATVTVRHQKMKLNLAHPNGHLSGSHLAGHILHQQLAQCALRPRDASTSGPSSRHYSGWSSTQASRQKPDVDSGFVFGISNHSPSKTNSTLEASLCLAHISLDALLSSSNPPPSVASGNSLPDETKSSALLLPLVEETLKKFVSFLQSQKKSPSCSLPGTLSSTRLCSWNSPESLGGRSAGNGNSQESEVAYVLFVLYLLVSRSGHARASLIGGSSEKRDDGIHIESRGVMDAVVSLSLPRVERDCHLLDLLTYLANPVHSQNARHGHFIPVLCLRALRILIQSSREGDVTKFLPLLKSSCLSNCLNCDSNAQPNFFLAKHALKLLSSAVLLRPVASGLCSFTESCLLLSVISFCSEQKFPASWTSPAVTSIHHQMVSIVGAILRHHFLGSRRLTSASCECSAKIVKGLLHVVCEEYRIFLSSESGASMAVIRQGVSVLQLLTVHDKAFVTKSLDVIGDNYVALIDIRKLFKSHHEAPDHEVENEFWELLPFSGSSSDEENMEGIETDRPAKETPWANELRPSTSNDA